MSETLLAFAHTTDAISAERALLARKIAVRVMPVPGAISAGCGICLRVTDWRAATAALLDAGVAIQGVHADAQGGYAPVDWTFTGALGLRWGDMAALVGCGGKTSLMYRLARENRHGKTVITTTTRIRRPDAALYDREISSRGPLMPGISLLSGGMVEGGKLSGPPEGALDALRAEDALLLVEADGSRGLPLKGWADYEPVVPSTTTTTVGVCALWPIGQCVSEENTHRPALFEALTGTAIGEEITLDTIAEMIGRPEGLFGKAIGRKVLYINQVETDAALAESRALVRRLPYIFARDLSRIVCGSLREGRHIILYSKDEANE